MRIFKTRLFNRWAVDVKITDEALCNAVGDMECGLIGANLGGYVYKKRIAIQGKGKSAGVRTIIAYKTENKAFFVYGYAKGKRANISTDELKAFKKMASNLLGYSDAALDKAINVGKLFEVMTHE